jgi:hypothetical protein
VASGEAAATLSSDRVCVGRKIQLHLTLSAIGPSCFLAPAVAALGTETDPALVGGETPGRTVHSSKAS